MVKTGSFEKTKMLDRLRALCSKREYCTADIRKKICDAYAKAETADCSKEEAVEEILESLRKDRYLSDLRYATAFARDKASLSGWGEVKIRYMLSSKGIAKKDIDEALAEIDGSQADNRMEKLILAKYNTLKEDPQGKLKLLRYALGRGYTYDDIADYIDSLFSGRR